VLRAAVARFFPGADGAMKHACVCTFTNTPDSHFIIDAHPRHSQVPPPWRRHAPPRSPFPHDTPLQPRLAAQVILCSACSGHGFKFASVIGEVLADLAQTGATRHDISLHRLARFQPKASL